MQWIRERNAEIEDFQSHNHFRTRGDFFELMVQADKDAPGLIASLAEDLTALGEPLDIESLQELAQERTELPFDADMLLTAACARALGRNPQLATWLKIRMIARNSWQIEHWLREAMSACAEKDAVARKAYVDLAICLFEALESGGLKSESKRRNEEREGAWAHWQDAEYHLEELWGGLRGSDFMSYEEEMRIFGLLSEIAPADFQQLITDSKNPFLVDTALLSAGMGAFSPRFAQWEACARAAPLAFTQDGSWTGSVLLPLLLVHARNELIEPGRQIPRYDADEAEVAALTAQVAELVRAVVNVLACREDASAMFARWSTWLMRQVLRQREKDFSDIRSHSFVDNALLEAMGKAMRGWPLIQAAPEDAAPWEAWCYRCVRSSFAHDGFIDTPSFEEFASEWRLTPENWHGPEGRGLLERADLHIPGDDIPGMSANLLAFPMASRDAFASGWQQLWDSAYDLREVLEFGSVDAGTKTYSDRADASRLLLLLGCMGLACFDQAAARLETSPERLAEEMASLHGALAAAAMEALHMDDTINRDKWQALLQHLALRRVYWDDSYAAAHRVAVFAGHQAPTIRDYLGYFQADPGDLVAFLHACMLNELDAYKLREELRGASVDLRTCLDTLERLHGLREHRYPMDGRAIKAIEPLMG
ncbi:hypothetical protein J3D54_004647 [Pseudomonas sp. GGS8]|uniref:hypothetical protein n=1 Tax=Pseudomonas sp. GGS8 TaxID=2817892 RepID=UPI00209F0A40|nr:hypothetical protein [Pseudomonas sp. GGS8]MCP1445515.1 hypothetical protein [Pseudomonas sp. GGS8]